MTSSPLHTNGYAHAEGSSSRASAARQPYDEDEGSGDEADLLGDDPLDGDLGTKYALMQLISEEDWQL